MSSKKRKEQYRASKSKARQQQRARPRIYKAFKKADAERKRKKRKLESQEKKSMFKEIARLKAKVQEQKKGLQEQKKGYLDAMARKENANAKARFEQTKHVKEQKAKTEKWEGFWKRLPREMQGACVGRTRAAYPENCPRRGWHKDENYWDPKISGRL